MPKSCRVPLLPPRRLVAAGVLLLLAAGRAAGGLPVIGFTEPRVRVDVSAVESGTLAELSARKGQRVRAGQPLGRLDDEVLRSRLALAEARAEERSATRAAEVRLDLARRKQQRLQVLREEGHGGREEMARADAEVELAETDVQAAVEARTAAALQVRQIEAELRRRQIVAPFAGTVADVLKDVGEFIGSADAAVVTLVDLTQLRVSFFVPTAEADGLRGDAAVSVRVLPAGRVVSGRVEFVSPLIDADSDTVRVDVLLDNADRGIRSGRRCELIVGRTGRSSATATTAREDRR